MAAKRNIFGVAYDLLSDQNALAGIEKAKGFLAMIGSASNGIEKTKDLIAQEGAGIAAMLSGLAKTLCVKVKDIAAKLGQTLKIIKLGDIDIPVPARFPVSLVNKVIAHCQDGDALSLLLKLPETLEQFVPLLDTPDNDGSFKNEDSFDVI